jgi:hypothetical protein
MTYSIVTLLFSQNFTVKIGLKMETADILPCQHVPNNFGTIMYWKQCAQRMSPTSDLYLVWKFEMHGVLPPHLPYIFMV